jgi:tetratricopeptide (TPR) repeat protein
MKRTFILLIGVILTATFNLNAQTKVDEANKLIKNKDYAAALKIAGDCLGMDSTASALNVLIKLREKEYTKDKKLFQYLGDTYSKMNVSELALLNYDQAEKMDSIDIKLKFKIAELLIKEKKYTDAVNKFLKIVTLDSKNTKALLQAANILYQAKMYADAGVVFEKYIELEQSEETYQRISRCFIETKKYDKAYTYSTEGLKKYPKNVPMNKYAAISSFGLQKFADAGKYYSAVPDSQLTVSDLKNAGRAFQLSGVDSIAIKYFEKVIEKDSTQSSLFMDMANNYFRKKDNQQAIKYYKAKIQTEPNYEPAYRYMGFAYFDMKDWSGARESFLKAKELNDTTFTTNYWLAQTFNQMDSLDQAADQYTKILKLTEGKEKQYKNEILEASGFLGQRAFTKKNYSAAITYTAKALQLKPGEWRFMELLGACHQILQNYDEAIKWFCQTLKYNSKSEVARKGLRMMSADDCIPKK